MTTRAQRSRGLPRRTVVPAPSTTRLPVAIGGALLVIIAIAAVAAIVLGSARSTGGPAEPATQPVTITGTALPALTDPAADMAIGQPLPELTGVDVDGLPLSIGPADGPMAIVVLAHWCSFCQAEVPELVRYLEAGSLPAGMRVMALTTSIDPARPNYPPSSWLERERWTVPTMVDDASARGLAAMGLSSFPGFVFVDGDGRVAYRTSGALGAEAFGQIVKQLAP